jgi:hypothetical protein
MTTSWVIDQTIPPRRRLGAFSAFTRLPGVANNRCAAVAERRWEPSTQMPFGWPLRANRDSYPSGSAPILDPSERDYAGFWLRTSENAVSTHSRNAAPSRPDRTRTAGEGTSCSRGITASCACTRRRPRFWPLCPVRRRIGHRTVAKRRAGSRRGKETGPTITSHPSHAEKIPRPWRRAEPPILTNLMRPSWLVNT